MIFSAKQVYVPTSDDCVLIIVSKLVITVSFSVSVTLYLVASDTFIIISLNCQVIFGNGSPIAWQLNVTGFVSFSSDSVT